MLKFGDILVFCKVKLLSPKKKCLQKNNSNRKTILKYRIRIFTSQS
jgi:hypothetical protein